MISLGIDIGGTGAKCVAFREDGSQVAVTYEEYAIAPGTVDLPPSALRKSVLDVIAQCVAKLPDKSEVAVITTASFGESFVAIDGNGEPVSDIMMYFGNAESAAFDALVDKMGVETCMRIARVYPDASYSLAKMLYTMQNADRPVAKFLFIADYVSYCLSGQMRAVETLACRSMLYDVEKRCWSKELIEKSGIDPATLCEVVPTGTQVGTLTREAAEAIGLSTDVAVVSASHDQIMNALGAGVEEIGDAVNVSGTVECIVPLYGSIPDSLDMQKDNYAVVPYFDRGYVAYAYSISGGSVIRWVRDALGMYLADEAKNAGKSIYDVLNETCPDSPTDLLILPYLQGMGGTPDVDAGATGTIAGLTTRTRVPEIYRAVLEGITFEDRYNLERMKAYQICPEKLIACGGGAKSAVWSQIKADILGIPIVPVDMDETGAFGSAALGFSAVTGEDPFVIAARSRRFGPTFTPDPARAALYDERYEAWKALRMAYTAGRTNK